jgi:hypothetical protein
MKTKKTTLAQELVHWQRVDPFCQEAGWVDKTRNVPLAVTVAEVSTSGFVILPKEKGTVLNVLGLVIQRQLDYRPTGRPKTCRLCPQHDFECQQLESRQLSLLARDLGRDARPQLAPASNPSAAASRGARRTRS